MSDHEIDAVKRVVDHAIDKLVELAECVRDGAKLHSDLMIKHSALEARVRELELRANYNRSQ